MFHSILTKTQVQAEQGAATMPLVYPASQSKKFNFPMLGLADNCKISHGWFLHLHGWCRYADSQWLLQGPQGQWHRNSPISTRKIYKCHPFKWHITIHWSIIPELHDGYTSSLPHLRSIIADGAGPAWKLWRLAVRIRSAIRHGWSLYFRDHFWGSGSCELALVPIARKLT